MSYVSMPAQEVRKLAADCIQNIQNQREAFWQKMVEDERGRYERSWFRRLFRRPVPSDAEIRKELETGGPGDNFFSIKSMVGMMYAGSEEVAKNLIRATEHAQVIQVSTEDLRKIGG